MIVPPLDLLPRAASTTGARVDLVAFVVFSVIGLVSAAVIAALVVFAVRYRRRPGRVVGHVHAPAVIRRTELLWAAITTFVFLGLFALGAGVFDDFHRLPDRGDIVDIEVRAKRWMWSFQHPTGRRELERLHIPANRIIRLHLTSDDVIHSFYVPAFRLKQDVVPGLARTAWFEATETGTYALACAEFCGTEHADMRAEIVVLEPHIYDAWLARRADDPAPLAAAGRQVFERLDCGPCHETHTYRRAPPLVGLYDHQVVLRDGTRVRADDDYIRRSILRPGADIVAGYDDGVMPSYEGLVDDDDLLLLVAYIRSLAAREGVHP